MVFSLRKDHLRPAWGMVGPRTGIELDARSYKWIVLLITCMGSMMGPLDSTIVSVSLPTISSDLNMDYATSIWVPTAYLVSLALLLLTIGRLSDMKGRKPIFIVGFLIFVIGSFLCSISASGYELIVFRVIQGAGAAFIMSTATAIVTNIFPSNERGKALGLNTMSAYIGLSLGPALGGFLTEAFGWQSIFWVNIPIGSIAIVLALTQLKEERPVKHVEPFDISGMLAFSVGLISVLIALTIGEQVSWASPLIIGLLVISLMAFTIFYLIEKRKGKAAMFDLSLISNNRLFAYANLATLLNYAAYFGVAFLMSFYLQRVIGLSLVQTGLVLLAMPLTMSILAPLSGWASDRIGSRVLSTVGMIIIGISLVLMSTLDQSSSILTISLYLVLIGAGMGLFSSPNTSAVMGCVGRSQLGVASGTLATMRTVGQSLSLAMMGALLAISASTVVVSTVFSGAAVSLSQSVISEFVRGMHLAYLGSAIIAFVGATASYARGPKVVCPEPVIGH